MISCSTSNSSLSDLFIRDENEKISRDEVVSRGEEEVVNYGGVNGLGVERSPKTVEVVSMNRGVSGNIGRDEVDSKCEEKVVKYGGFNKLGVERSPETVKAVSVNWITLNLYT